MAQQDPDITAAIQSSGELTLEGAAAKAKEEYDKLMHVTLDIAVTGESGAGKSSFVNAIRGLSDDDDDGAAPTGVTETTKEPTMYLHPTMPNIRVWDLPGIGTQNFKAKQYIKDVNFNTYDFFIIISSERFKENDIMLAKEIKKNKKKFYFVRSKIDNDICTEMRKAGFNEQNVLLKIREDCKKNLVDFKDCKVFLISSLEINKYDFQLLEDTLEKDLPATKRYALIKAWPVCSKEVFKRKVEAFQKSIWALAFLSAGVAVAPVPGMSAAFDASVVMGFFASCYRAFGLDDASLERLSKRTGKDLKPLRKSKFVSALKNDVSLPVRISALALVEYISSLIPGVGSAAAAGISFGTTKWILNKGLNEIIDTAREIMKEAGLEC
ncbi:interferon-inducible GTPase 5-like [Chanos chanos]|uniref:Interferon-inducible GTPase 5-like n=1 Tax=Chanos chanos TaxID=29144 RepID=A0A6J2WAF4_CHACN|nr:interferon-inducible GTPase 5-like [Chanos chanos]